MGNESIFLAWTESDMEGLDLETLYTEVTTSGLVVREVGLDSNGVVVHKSPSRASPRGYFDLAIISMENLTSDISSQEFEALWDTPIEL